MVCWPICRGDLPLHLFQPALRDLLNALSGARHHAGQGSCGVGIITLVNCRYQASFKTVSIKKIMQNRLQGIHNIAGSFAGIRCVGKFALVLWPR